MIQLDHVSKSFHDGKQVVRNVSFKVDKGETMILLGTSGSGKTTTLRMINRLTEPSSGTIYVNGKDITTQQTEILRKNIGYVLQANGLFPHYTVAQNIAIVPELSGWDKKRTHERTISLMEKLHLSVSDHLHAYPQQLSGGQQQRVGLARALAADPPVLLMDEPFGALDPVTRARVRKEFRTLDEINNKTVIIVTHDVQEAFELGTYICLMDKGIVQQVGTPKELLFSPANKFVETFFDEQRFSLELQALKIADVITGNDDDKRSCWEAINDPSADTTAVINAVKQYKHGRTAKPH